MSISVLIYNKLYEIESGLFSVKENWESGGKFSCPESQRSLTDIYHQRREEEREGREKKKEGNR